MRLRARKGLRNGGFNHGFWSYDFPGFWRRTCRDHLRLGIHWYSHKTVPVLLVNVIGLI